MTENYTYDAFGTLTYIQSLNEEGVLTQTDTVLSRFLYAGEQYDEVAGLYYLRARRYDTTIGRFTQEDTYLGDGRNLYVYVQNNPLKYVDPSGYCSKNSSNGYLEMQNASFSGADTMGGMTGQNIGALISEQIQKALNQLPPEEEQRIRDGVWNVTVGGTVIASGGMALGALPAAAPAVTVTATKILAGTTFAFGAADITEGTQDIIYGSTGNTATSSFNPVKDIVFGGNQQNYDSFEFALAGATFGLGVYSTGAFSMPLSAGDVGYYANLPTRFLGNKIYMNGLNGERELMKMFGGTSQVYFYTSLGGRYIDQLANNIAHESKVGYTTLTNRIMTQIQKDAELISKGIIDGSVWHFFESAVNGKKGASEELIKYLIEKGIEYIIH